MPFFQNSGMSRLAALTAALIVGTPGAAEPAPTLHAHHLGQSHQAVTPAPFVASLEKPYAALMDDAMNVMNAGMTQAPMNGDPDHDFAAMMVPHHQGAVDMAKAELLYGKNPVLRRLAQEIIVTQGQEIQVMQGELRKKSAPLSAHPQ